MFEHIDDEINIQSLCQLNRIAGKYTVINAGSIRDMYDDEIRVPLFDGKNYYPELPPDKSVIAANIKRIISDQTLNGALELFCYICKAQLFNDGNKRTATLFTNMFMIQNGMGILSIPVEKRLDFYNALTMYYDSDSNKDELKEFLNRYCLTGCEIQQNIDSPSCEEPKRNDGNEPDSTDSRDSFDI